MLWATVRAETFPASSSTCRADHDGKQKNEMVRTDKDVVDPG
jgi:hypothetical protein